MASVTRLQGLRHMVSELGIHDWNLIGTLTQTWPSDHPRKSQESGAGDNDCFEVGEYRAIQSAAVNKPVAVILAYVCITFETFGSISFVHCVRLHPLLP